MTARWTSEELQRIGAARELQIAGRRADGTLRRCELRAGIDAAYSAKYGRHGGTERMVTDEAAAATLRISPDRPGDAP